jgi:lauroyl/myristoyl acyltransferase
VNFGKADRRTGGTWTRRQALKNALIRAAIRVLLAMVDRLPRGLLLGCGRGAGRAAAALLRDAHARARERALSALTAPAAHDVARSCFEHAGENLAISALLRRPSVRAPSIVAVSEASQAVLAAALAHGRGAIVVSAHVGPFEAIPAAVAGLGLRPAVVVRESYDPRLDPVVDAHRRARGVDVIHRGAAGAALAVVRALRRNQPVGLLPDLGGRGIATAPVRFLGGTVAFPVGPGELARRVRCPLLLGVLARRNAPAGPPFELLFERIPVVGTVAELTQRVAEAIERAIRNAPADWLWMAAPHLTIAEDSEESLSLNTMRHSELGRV